MHQYHTITLRVFDLIHQVQVDAEFMENTVHTPMKLCKTRAASPTSPSRYPVQGYAHPDPCPPTSISSSK
jgi:hypothetical protein